MFRAITGMLAVAVCLSLATPCLGTGAQDPTGTAHAMSSPEPEKAVSVEEKLNEFQDPLETPARMSALAPSTHLNAVAAAGKRVVSAGVRGIIVYSDDMGKSWIQAKVPVSVDLTALCFPTGQKGWAVGHDGTILNTSDAGATWTKQLDGRGVCRIMDKYYTDHPLPAELDEAAAKRLLGEIRFTVEQGPVTPFLDVWFDNERDGYAVGAFNLIFHTTDGGNTWVPWFDRTDNPSILHFYSVARVGGELFLSGEQGLLWKLDAVSGRFKAVQTPYIGTLFGTVGRDNTVLTYGQRGNLYRSPDGGASWEKVDSGVSETIFDGTMTPDGHVVLVTQAGNVIMSKDDGKRFTIVKHSAGDIPEHAVAALDKTTLAIAGMVGVHLESIQ